MEAAGGSNVGFKGRRWMVFMPNRRMEAIYMFYRSVESLQTAGILMHRQWIEGYSSVKDDFMETSGCFSVFVRSLETGSGSGVQCIIWL